MVAMITATRARPDRAIRGDVTRGQGAETVPRGDRQKTPELGAVNASPPAAAARVCGKSGISSGIVRTVVDLRRTTNNKASGAGVN